MWALTLGEQKQDYKALKEHKIVISHFARKT